MTDHYALPELPRITMLGPTGEIATLNFEDGPVIAMFGSRADAEHAQREHGVTGEIHEIDDPKELVRFYESVMADGLTGVGMYTEENQSGCVVLMLADLLESARKVASE